MEMFHSNDGLFFKREGNGAVTITKTTDGKTPAEDGSNAVFSQTIDDGAWCSAVCSVSLGGEAYERWYSAMAFHNTPETETPEYKKHHGVPSES
jgi:hypothetical protein